MIFDLSKFAIKSTDIYTEQLMYEQSALNIKKILSTINTENGISIVTLDKFNKMKHELTSYLVSSVLDPKYYNNPHGLSKSLYNITDLWYILCLLNSAASAMDFNMKEVVYLNKEGIIYLITRLSYGSTSVTTTNKDLVIKKI